MLRRQTNAREDLNQLPPADSLPVSVLAPVPVEIPTDSQTILTEAAPVAAADRGKGMKHKQKMGMDMKMGMKMGMGMAEFLRDTLI